MNYRLKIDKRNNFFLPHHLSHSQQGGLKGRVRGRGRGEISSKRTNSKGPLFMSPTENYTTLIRPFIGASILLDVPEERYHRKGSVEVTEEGREEVEGVGFEVKGTEFGRGGGEGGREGEEAVFGEVEGV